MSNNRLQVGGLALTIKSVNPKNLGLVVKIVDVGVEYDWIVDGDFDNSHIPEYKRHLPFGAMSAALLPLGDKESQDQIMRKIELEKVDRLERSV